MNIREQQQEYEKQTLAGWATKACESRGRQKPMEECPYRTCFQRDRDRIIHSKAFRRLSNKTQVFISPEGDHYRARLTHTLEVAQIARTVARALSLNEDLTEAIALGHDLGHTPFGHAGERALNEVCPLGFRHNEQSLRMVDRIEELNLTYEVRNGIVCHTGAKKADTPEGRIIHYADRIAYINHDIDDALRGGLIRVEHIPGHLLDRLGHTHGRRIDTMVTAMIDYGQQHQEIGMSPAVHEDMLELRSYMFQHVYHGTGAQSEEQRARNMLRMLYAYFVSHPDELPPDYFVLRTRGEPLERVVCDYIACMTDRYSIATYKKLFIPKSWNKIED